MLPPGARLSSVGTNPGAIGVDADAQVSPLHRHGRRQVLEAGLGCAVLSGHRVGLGAAARRDVDDRTAVPDHRAGGRLSGEEGPLQVQIDHCVPSVFGEIDQWSDVLGAGASCVVHPAVEGAELVERGADDPIEIGSNGDVGDDRNRSGPHRVQLGDRLDERRFGPAAHHHTGPRGGERTRDAPPDAPSASRHDGCGAGQVEHAHRWPPEVADVPRCQFPTRCSPPGSPPR